MNKHDKADLQGTIILQVAGLTLIALCIGAAFAGSATRTAVDTYWVRYDIAKEWCDERFCMNTTYNTSRCYDYTFWKEYNCTTSANTTTSNVVRL